MSVYVGVSMWPYGRMVMCHMVADSETELDEMATKLGLRRWKQIPKRDQGVGALVHYDISKSKRAEAIKLGAIPLDDLHAEAEVLERLAEELAAEKSGNDRILGADAAVAVGRFDPDGPHGYCAKSGGPLRATRAEAETDYRATLCKRDR